MAELHIHESDPVVVSNSGDRSAAAGINMITVLIVLLVLAALAWFLFTGPLRSMNPSNPGTTINNNPPAQNQPNISINPNVNVNPPAAPSPAR